MASWLLHFCYFEKAGLGNILLLHHYPGMRVYSFSFGYGCITMWQKYFPLLVLKATLQLNLSDCSTCSNTCLYTLSHYIYITNDCEKTFSFLQCCWNINTEVFGQKHCDVRKWLKTTSTIYKFKEIYTFMENQKSQILQFSSLLSLHERASSHPDWPWGEHLKVPSINNQEPVSTYYITSGLNPLI